jgi:hypothetical protein
MLRKSSQPLCLLVVWAHVCTEHSTQLVLILKPTGCMLYLATVCYQSSYFPQGFAAGIIMEGQCTSVGRVEGPVAHHVRALTRTLRSGPSCTHPARPAEPAKR